MNDNARGQLASLMWPSGGLRRAGSRVVIMQCREKCRAL